MSCTLSEFLKMKNDIKNNGKLSLPNHPDPKILVLRVEWRVGTIMGFEMFFNEYEMKYAKVSKLFELFVQEANQHYDEYTTKGVHAKCH